MSVNRAEHAIWQAAVARGDTMVGFEEWQADSGAHPSGFCEDYPCCGHTPADPCQRQWYDEPDAFNPRVNPHCFCEHEHGFCDVDDYEDEE